MGGGGNYRQTSCNQLVQTFSLTANNTKSPLFIRSFSENVPRIIIVMEIDTGSCRKLHAFDLPVHHCISTDKVKENENYDCDPVKK